MAGDGTVEFGAARRPGLLDRLFGTGPGGAGSRRNTLSAPALACAVIAVALFAAAELLPWMTVNVAATPGGQPGTDIKELPIQALGVGLVVPYYAGCAALLTLIGLVLVSRPHARRVLTAAGLGIAVAELIVLLGCIRWAGRGGEYAYSFSVDATVEVGPYFAVVGVLVAGAALVLSGWRPGLFSRRAGAPAPEPEDDPDAEPGPIDLTVSSG
jgi:hypothetical protein